MNTVLVASSKGGVGKTTLATHLAAHAAVAGQHSVLVDADPQGSSTRWAERRAGAAPVEVIAGASGHKRAWAAIPAHAGQVVIDAPAGARADALATYLEHANAVLVPVLPSALDIEATVPFLDDLSRHPRVRRGDARVGLVVNRLRPRTHASQQTLDLLKQWPYPVLAQLRDSQAYVVLVGLGKSLFDYHSAKVRERQREWQPVLKWLRKQAA